MKKELQPKKDKLSHLPLLPLSHRQNLRKASTRKEKMKNLESCLKKIKSHDKAPRKAKEVETAKPNQETNESKPTKPAKHETTTASKGKEEVKEKRKPGRPAKKKLND
jgi:hypothetical protein